MERKTVDMKPFLLNLSKLIAIIIFVASVTWGTAAIKIDLENRVKNTEKTLENHETRITTLEDRANDKDVQDAEMKADLKYIKNWVEKQDKK